MRAEMAAAAAGTEPAANEMPTPDVSDEEEEEAQSLAPQVGLTDRPTDRPIDCLQMDYSD